MLGGSGALAVPFWHNFGCHRGPDGVLFKGFWGLVPSLGAVGAQFAPGPPGAFHPPLLFSDFGAQRELKGVQHSAKMENKTIKKLMQKTM